jgi:hypothetical protein
VRTESAWKGLNENSVAELSADAQARVTNEADKVGVAPEQFNLLFFAKAEFAQAVDNLGRGSQTLDADGRAGHHAAQRAEIRIGVAASVH